MKCIVSLANMMAEDTHRSELLTQLLYNDNIELLDKRGVWMKVRTQYNETEGWVLTAQFCEIDDSTFNLSPLFISFIEDIKKTSSACIQGTFHNEEQINTVALNTILPDEETIRSILCSYVDAPYMWGGITKQGIDCSGLSLILYRFLGIPLPCFAVEQSKHGIMLDFLQSARIGDLAFFESEEGLITHVGVLLSPTEIIHSTEKAGKVVIDLIDHAGIISKQTGQRTHKLRVIKRYLN